MWKIEYSLKMGHKIYRSPCYLIIYVFSSQLIDSFAWEIGTLKKEMGKKSESRKKDHKAETKFG